MWINLILSLMGKKDLCLNIMVIWSDYFMKLNVRDLLHPTPNAPQIQVPMSIGTLESHRRVELLVH